ncbi:MAG: MarR family transcriptional regulator [Clostridia bacterium]|nr:MarR family transcriptional regulator [Clostridia bacterium]
MATRQEQHALWDAVDTIHRYYEELFRPVASAFSLTAGQLKVLHTLHRFGALTVGELAGAVGMARTNMSSLCKKLCKLGFLVRHRGFAGDERQVILELTPEGESAARQADSQLDLAAPALREGNLVSLTEELSALAETLFPDSAEVAKKKKRIPAAAAKMFDRAKSVILEKTTKKELQHGKDI